MMRCRLHYTFTAEFASKRIVKMSEPLKLRPYGDIQICLLLLPLLLIKFRQRLAK